MSEPLAAAAAELVLTEPSVPEELREGDPGGPPCGYCALTDDEAVWASTHWRAITRSWSPLPGSIMLLSKAHLDSISDMPRARQEEFGVISAAIERAIMDLGGAARVHLYRWGDGRAHFHAHFIPRPLGRPQFGWRNLPFLEGRLPHPGEKALASAAEAVGAALHLANLPA